MISIIVFYFAICSMANKDKINNIQNNDCLIFYHITDLKDTCLISYLLVDVYYNLNIKILDEQTFYYHFMNKVFNGDIIEVSEDYYQKNEQYKINSVDAIDNIYNNYGLDSLLNYMYKYPINQLLKDDLAAFDWGTYILWQNGIYVSLDDETNMWYINADGYRW
ncbi:MAG: hypothetical protein IKN91_01290 [Paludibacteraceae bacterium]|nr:hypothetical protein [Paludibacteraceae bacterium]